MKPNLEFNLAKKVIDFSAQKYNETKNNSNEKLKRGHLELMYDLIRLYRKRLYNNYYALPDFLQKNYDELSVSTNNVILSERLHCSGMTIKRHRLRLKSAKMIVEKWHGTNKDYEIFINTGYLSIFDYENPYFSPKLYFVKYQETIISNRTNCSPITVTYKLHLNKTVILCEKVITIFKDESIVGNTSIGYTQKQVKNLHKNSKNNEDYWGEVESKAQKRQQIKTNAAKALVNKYIALLLADKDVFDGEKFKAQEIVEENYFPNNDSESINSLLKIYLERIDLVKKYSEMHEGYQAPFPARYFDVTNHQNGFINTKKWYFDTKNWNSQKSKQKKKEKQNQVKLSRELADEKKLAKVLKLCIENPTTQNFLQQDIYVNQYLPYLFDKYINQRTELLSAKK